VLLDSKADILLYGNAERALVEIAHRFASGESVDTMTDVRGTAYARVGVPEGFLEVDSTTVDTPGKVDEHVDPYAMDGMEGASRTTQSGRHTDPIDRVALRPQRAHPARQAGHPPAVLRAGQERRSALRARLPRHAPRDQPRQRALSRAAPRQARCVAQPAADPVDHTRNGRDLRPAVPARAAPGLRGRENSRVQHDPLLGEHHARLLRRLHLLLDHRCRTCRASPASSQTSVARPRTCIAWPASPPRSRKSAAGSPASTPTSARTSTPTTRR